MGLRYRLSFCVGVHHYFTCSKCSLLCSGFAGLWARAHTTSKLK